MPSTSLQHRYLVLLMGKQERDTEMGSVLLKRHGSLHIAQSAKDHREKKMLAISASSKAPSTKKSSKVRRAPDFHLLVWLRSEVTAGGATGQ